MSGCAVLLENRADEDELERGVLAGRSEGEGSGCCYCGKSEGEGDGRDLHILVVGNQLGRNVLFVDFVV